MQSYDFFIESGEFQIKKQMNFFRRSKILFAPVLSLLLFFILNYFAVDQPVSFMLSITLWMALWWMMETVHYAVTALLPFFLFPLLNIMDAKATAGSYMDPVIFLFIGGFIIAFAIEKWGLHRRLALRILLLSGISPTKALFGIMICTYFISMWISNTATAMMMIPAVLSVIGKVEEEYGSESKKIPSALLLGLAYAASIGGTATLVGTPPNMVFAGFYNNHFDGNEPITFAGWFVFAFPVSFVLLIIAFLLLKRIYFPGIKKKVPVESSASLSLKKEYESLGKMSFEEKIVLVCFILAAFLWFFRSDIDIGFFKIFGWSNIFPDKKFIDDSVVAILMAVILFLIPAKRDKGKMLMGWDDVKKLPFGIIILFGGGFALAKGFEVSGLTVWLSAKLHIFRDMPYFILVAGMCAFIVLLSEFASNTATIQLSLPILMALSKAVNIPPLLVMIPATLAASYSFMLPVGTPPNTIVFGTGRLTVKEMIKTGFIMDIIGIILVVLAMVVYKNLL